VSQVELWKFTFLSEWIWYNNTVEEKG